MIPYLLLVSFCIANEFEIIIPSKQQICLGEILQAEELFIGEIIAPTPNYSVSIFDDEANIIYIKNDNQTLSKFSFT